MGLHLGVYEPARNSDGFIEKSCNLLFLEAHCHIRYKLKGVF